MKLEDVPDIARAAVLLPNAIMARVDRAIERRMERHDELEAERLARKGTVHWWFVGAFIGLILLLLTAGCEDPWKRCKEQGGWVERYNCRDRTWMSPIYSMDGKHTIIGWETHHSTHCDEKCVGANPEALPPISKDGGQ